MHVISARNLRLDPPFLDMKSIFSSESMNDPHEWKSNSSKGPLNVIITDVGSSLSLTLKMRGYLYDVSSRVPLCKRISEVFVGSTRIPVFDVSVIGRRGNKVIVDVSFMISVLDVKSVDDRAWTFQISLSKDFNAFVFLSSLTRSTYLCALVEEPTTMALDVSPVSFTLMWPHGSPNLKPSVKVNSVMVEFEPSQSSQSSPCRIRVDAVPETEYACEVDNGLKKYELTLKTPSVSREAYENHYRSCRILDGCRTYDLSRTKKECVRDLRRLGVISPGDRVILDNTDRVLVAVGSGDTISSSGSFYVIPSFEEDKEQYLCLESPDGSGSDLVYFDNTESFVGYNSKEFYHGDRFVVGSRMVEVVEGSLILVLYDDVPLEFPGGVTTASTVSSAGDIVLRDLIMQSSSQVTQKVSGDFTYGSSSYYVYDSINGTTLETTRVRHSLDDSGEIGSISFNVLYTSSSGTQVMHPSLEVDPSKAKFSAVDSTGSLEATLDSSGLRFNSDSGDVYFGSSQEFRIHFEPSSGNDPAMLQIQGYDTGSGGYVTRQLITNEPIG